MEMQELVEKLNYYTKLYDEGHPAISDKEWDDLYFKLQEMEKKTEVVMANSPTNHIDFVVKSELEKVEHNHPMLSLAKTKSFDDVITFADHRELLGMAKIDGLTCSLCYIDGVLTRAETRGNGLIGEDITHNIVHVKEVPLTIPAKGEVIIDGEIICTYNDFDEFKGEFSNPRNFAAGSIRLLDASECAARHLTFIAWDCIRGLEQCRTLNDKFIYMCQEWKLHPAPWLKLPADMVDNDHLTHLSILLKEWARDDNIPIDGLVFKYNDCEYYSSLGATGHHFRGGLAYKFYDEEYETILRDIEWSIGKTGQLTPVAIFDDVDFGDSIVNRASLHNLNILRQILGGFPHKGQKIWVAKMNMIIPQVMRSIPDFDSIPGVDDKDRLLNYPAHCPICGGETKISYSYEIVEY